MTKPRGEILPQTPTIGGGYIPTGGYGGGGYTPTSGIPAMSSQPPTVTDPEETFAQITRDQYNTFRRDFGQFERDLIDRANTDTSLIDAARRSSAAADKRARGVSERMASRFGTQLTPAQLKAKQDNFALTDALNTTDSVNNARLAQRDLNEEMKAQLVNIGQGIQSSSLSGLANAAGQANQLDQAYKNARTQHRNSNISTAAGLGSMALMALAF